MRKSYRNAGRWSVAAMCTFLSFPQQALAAGWSNDPAPYQVEKNRNAISGVVLDEFGDPVIGANIVIKGSQIGTTTNENGQFEVSGVTTGTLAGGTAAL